LLIKNKQFSNLKEMGRIGQVSKESKKEDNEGSNNYNSSYYSNETLSLKDELEKTKNEALLKEKEISSLKLLLKDVEGLLKETENSLSEQLNKTIELTQLNNDYKTEFDYLRKEISFKDEKNVFFYYNIL
jgi:hypothetical protein